MRKVLLVMLFVVFAGMSSLDAYTDQITVKAPEAWQVALKIMKPYGIKKEDPKTMTIETKWIKDTVVRSRGPLKKLTGKYYERRYRLKVSVTQRDYDTEIQIKGRYQIRSLDTRSNLILWETIKPTAQDYQIEQDIFMNILKTLEVARNSETQNG